MEGAVRFQLHPQGKCLSSGINAAAAADACDSRLSGIYITRRANVGKQNKQPKKIQLKKAGKNQSKRLQPPGRPGGGASHL